MFLSSAFKDDNAKRNGHLSGRVPGAHTQDKKRCGRETQETNHTVLETEEERLV